jgi:hypothetical protein
VQYLNQFPKVWQSRALYSSLCWVVAQGARPRGTFGFFEKLTLGGCITLHAKEEKMYEFPCRNVHEYSQATFLWTAPLPMATKREEAPSFPLE